MQLVWRCTAMLLPTLAGCQAATQSLAWHYGYHPALGTPLVSVGTLRVYRPWQAVQWIWRYSEASPETFTWPLALMAIGALVGMLSVLVLLLFQKPTPPITTYGSARWADPAEIKRSGLL